MTIATTPAQSLGADLRSLRKARGLTLADMAERMDKSLGWMSQVERNLSEPTPDELKAFAAIYDVPVSLFFGQPNAAPAELGRIVRGDARRALRTGVAGLVEELLSPDLSDDFEMFLSRFEPGAKMDHPNTRPTQELGYLIKGRLTFWIGGQEFDLQAGDSFRIRGEEYRWENPHAAPAEAVWVIAPPVY